ncbi:MAG: acetyltransferase [Clostridia bacterium]|nr:acetyltransferase [Clostridia bacterium]
MNNLVIIGASGHGKVIADIAEKVGYTDIVFLDDNPAVESCGSYKVVGGCKEALSYKSADFIVAIGNAKIRRKIQSQLVEAGLHIVSLVHPAAVIATNVKIGIGTVVMAGAVINPYTEIGQGCIINTCSSVDHDCQIGDYVHISVGAHVAGTVTIKENTWVGAGATISNNIEIVKDCMIGAGAVVVKNIEESSTQIGIPARKLGNGQLVGGSHL